MPRVRRRGHTVREERPVGEMSDAELAMGVRFWSEEFDRAKAANDAERVWEAFRREGDCMHERDRRLRDRNAIAKEGDTR
jgi:hypothetical protein